MNSPILQKGKEKLRDLSNWFKLMQLIKGRTGIKPTELSITSQSHTSSTLINELRAENKWNI